MPIARCKSPRPLEWAQIAPGITVHLAGASHCRAFVITSAEQIDPTTGHSVWQAMEVGDEAIVEGAKKPFTGVVLNLDQHAVHQWHLPS